MDAFHEEVERILGHAAEPYHRIDIAAPPVTSLLGRTICSPQKLTRP
jgi:hypothetical protein